MSQRGENMETLENLVDHSLSGVLCMLSEICSLKEDHVSSNWQDVELAKKWRKAELALEPLAR